MAGPVEPRDIVDWSAIFDIIASEYGYTWKQFTALTNLQLYAFLTAINKRRYNNTAIQASLHGVKMDPYTVKKIEKSEADLSNIQDIRNQILAEKQQNG